MLIYVTCITSIFLCYILCSPMIMPVTDINVASITMHMVQVYVFKYYSRHISFKKQFPPFS